MMEGDFCHFQEGKLILLMWNIASFTPQRNLVDWSTPLSLQPKVGIQDSTINPSLQLSLRLFTGWLLLKNKMIRSWSYICRHTHIHGEAFPMGRQVSMAFWPLGIGSCAQDPYAFLKFLHAPSPAFTFPVVMNSFDWKLHFISCCAPLKGSRKEFLAPISPRCSVGKILLALAFSYE